MGGRSFSITSTSFIDDDNYSSREVTVIRNTENTRVDEREDNRVSAATCKETISRSTEAEVSINVLNTDESNDRVRPSSVKVPQMVSSLLKYTENSQDIFYEHH